MFKTLMAGYLYFFSSINLAAAQNTTKIKYKQIQPLIENAFTGKAVNAKRYKVIVKALQPGEGEVEKEDILIATSLSKKITPSMLTEIQFSINNLNQPYQSFYYYKITIGLKL